MNQLDFSDRDKISQLFKQAVDKAIENHRQKGESIAISEQGGDYPPKSPLSKGDF